MQLDTRHNQPPAADDFTALNSRAETLAKTADRWMSERGDVDETTEHAASDFLVQLRACQKELEAARKRDQAPHQERLTEIRARYKIPTDMLDTCIQLMRQKIGKWLQAKEERRKALEKQRALDAAAAELQATIAEEAAKNSGKIREMADAKALREKAVETERALTETAVEKTRVVSDHGTQAGLQWRVYVEVADIEKVDLMALASYLDKAAVEKAIRAYVRANKEGDRLPTLRGALIEYRSTVASR